uniref:Uncharacterized protein n=1 Tax=Glossina austeni TaxID=7395 RepID=A0A1A9VS65_GLOAU
MACSEVVFVLKNYFAQKLDYSFESKEAKLKKKKSANYRLCGHNNLKFLKLGKKSTGPYNAIVYVRNRQQIRVVRQAN